VLHLRIDIEGNRGVRALEVNATLQRASQPRCCRLPLMHNRQIRFLEAHVDLERRLQQPLRQRHSRERQVDGEAYIQCDAFTGSVVQTTCTLQLALRVGQCVVELCEGKPLRRGRLHSQFALETRLGARAGKLHLECSAATNNVWEVEELLQIGQINLRRVQLDVLQLLAMQSAGELNGLIGIHQVYACEVKALRSKGHLERGHSLPGTVRQSDLEFFEHHLLARRIPGQCPTGPPTALSGLNYLGSKLYLSLGPIIGDVQRDLLDWQGSHLGAAYLQLRSQLWLTAELGAFVG